MDNKSFVLNFLTQDTFIQVNEKVLKALKGDCTSAIMLSKLISFYRVSAYRGTLEDDWFLVNVTYLYESIGINEYNQRRALQFMQDLGIIDIKFKNYPKQRFVKIDFDKVFNAIDVEVKSTKKVSKIEFYNTLNEGINTLTHKEALNCKGNIKQSLFDFMYAWSTLYTKKTDKKWTWDSKSFGIINHYWREVYTHKAFDFSNLIYYFDKDNDYNLYFFINTNKALSDKHPEDRVNMSSFLTTMGESNE